MHPTPFPADLVLTLYKEFCALNIELWIDGGWGVDALLGRQTRPHKDLDIAMHWKDVPALREHLAGQGYAQVRADNQWNFVLRNPEGYEIDVHAFIANAAGHAIEGIMYPPGSLEGHGSINDHPVCCIRADWMIQFHSGYELKPKDYNDIAALCEKFSIPLPAIFDDFRFR